VVTGKGDPLVSCRAARVPARCAAVHHSPALFALPPTTKPATEAGLPTADGISAMSETRRTVPRWNPARGSRTITHAPPASWPHLRCLGAGVWLGEWGRSKMKTRVIIEYDIPAGDRVVVREREDQRWTASETVLALPGSAKVRVELLELPLMPAV
jgi:hypothetical protein